MGKYLQLSRVYFDDKDLQDLFGFGVFGEKVLQNFARDRGIFLPKDETKPELINYLSRLAFDWSDISQLAQLVNTDDREERRTSTRVEKLTTFAPIEAAIREVQQHRATPCNEVYTATKIAADRYQVDVAYIEIDPTKSTPFQRREKSLTIEFEIGSERTDVRYTHNERARKIVDAVIKQLRAADENVKTNPIELSGIRDPVLRTEFFLELRNNVAGFRAIDVIDLDVDNRFPETTVPSNDEDGEEEEDDSVSGDQEKEETEEEAEIKSMVKRAALSGQGLLTSDLYKKLQETGYYITTMVWRTKELSGEGRLMEFVAGFDKPIAATEFFYDLRKVFPRDDPQDKKRTQIELLRAERNRVRKVLADAAFKSLQIVVQKSSGTTNTT